jgi:hypothetical protein
MVKLAIFSMSYFPFYKAYCAKFMLLQHTDP